MASVRPFAELRKGRTPDWDQSKSQIELPL